MSYSLILPQTYSLAGLGSGVTEAVIVNPFEVRKKGGRYQISNVKCQIKGCESQNANKQISSYTNHMVSDTHNLCVIPRGEMFSRSVAREIIKEDGIGRNGLLGKGITATMGRNGFFNMIYFGFYHTMKSHLPSYDDPKLEFCRKVSGVICHEVQKYS